MAVLNYRYVETESKDDYPKIDIEGNDISIYDWEFWSMRKTPEKTVAVWRREVTQ